jgi:hypothetical protein
MFVSTPLSIILAAIFVSCIWIAEFMPRKPAWPRILIILIAILSGLVAIVSVYGTLWLWVLS